jgi:hypothetical protein
MIEVHPAVPLGLPGAVPGQSGGKSTRDKTGGLNPGVFVTIVYIIVVINKGYT